MVFGQGMRLSMAGLGLGIIATLLFTRLLPGFLYKVEPNDRATLLMVAAGARSRALWTVTTLRPVARDGKQKRRVLECLDVLGVARSEEEDLPPADLELLLVHTVAEPSLENVEGHGRGGVMRALVDALGDQREGEPERPRLDQGPADPPAPDVTLGPAELGDLLVQVEGELLSGESAGDG